MNVYILRTAMLLAISVSCVNAKDNEIDYSKYEHIGSYIRDCSEISDKSLGLGEIYGNNFPLGDYRDNPPTGGAKVVEVKRERRLIKCEIYKSKDFKGTVVVGVE